MNLPSDGQTATLHGGCPSLKVSISQSDRRLDMQYSWEGPTRCWSFNGWLCNIEIQLGLATLLPNKPYPDIINRFPGQGRNQVNNERRVLFCTRPNIREKKYLCSSSLEIQEHHSRAPFFYKAIESATASVEQHTLNPNEHASASDGPKALPGRKQDTPPSCSRPCSDLLSRGSRYTR
jgi:hypothetical protein